MTLDDFSPREPPAAEEEPLRPSWALHDDSLLPLFEGEAEFYIDVFVKAFRRLKAALKIDDGLAVQAAGVIVTEVAKDKKVREIERGRQARRPPTARAARNAAPTHEPACPARFP